MLNTKDIEDFRNYFKPKAEKGRALPNPKSISDDTEFLLLGEDGFYTLHRMIDGKWHVGKVDINSQVYFRPV